MVVSTSVSSARNPLGATGEVQSSYIAASRFSGITENLLARRFVSTQREFRKEYCAALLLLAVLVNVLTSAYFIRSITCNFGDRCRYGPETILQTLNVLASSRKVLKHLKYPL